MLKNANNIIILLILYYQGRGIFLYFKGEVIWGEIKRLKLLQDLHRKAALICNFVILVNGYFHYIYLIYLEKDLYIENTMIAWFRAQLCTELNISNRVLPWVSQRILRNTPLLSRCAVSKGDEMVRKIAYINSKIQI